MLRAEVGTFDGALGLLDPRHAAARDAHAIDRRVENWVACALDDPARPAARSGWDRLIDGLPALRRSAKQGRRGAISGWARFRTTYRNGVTVVHVMERNLVKQADVAEMADDLFALIDAGYHRIILDFSVVERLTSWVVGTVAQAHRLCASADAGRLKVCGLRPELAAIFAITGVSREITLEASEATALEGPWPDPPGPRALPLEILSCLMRSAEGVLDEEPPPMPSIWLVIEVGRSKGQTVAIGVPRFLIGRDARCQLRPSSEAVSRVHACIEQQDGRIVLRDLGSTNGTYLNDRLLQGDEAELHHGDRIVLGPLAFTVAFGAPRSEGVEDRVSGWIQGARARVEEPADAEPETGNFPLLDGSDPRFRIKHEVVEDVLVVTPMAADLDDESTIGPLREELHAVFGRAMPRRVVLNLEYVTHVTGQAIGLFVAYHLRLDRAGGALRIGGVQARVMALFDQVRLPVLIDCNPSVDAAVLDPWPSVPSAS